MSQELIAIGKIVAPHGVRGDVRVIPLTDFPERFFKMKEVLVNGKLIPIEAAKWHKQFLLLKFRGLDDRNAVEALRGHLLEVAREDVLPLADGNFYVFDILGMEVYSDDGSQLGVVTDVIETGSNDVYVVEKTDKRQLLVPALKSIVTTVDVVGKRMIIRSPKEWDADED